MTRHHDNDGFDHAVRGLHRESLANLHPDTLRRLRTARTAAAGTRARHFGWPLASAAATLFVLAVALPLLRPAPMLSPPEVPGAQSSQATAHRRASATGPAPVPAPRTPPDDVPAMLAALEESPDFYLWLASNDVGPDALE